MRAVHELRREIQRGRSESAGGRVGFSAEAKRHAVEHARLRQAEGGRRLRLAARETGVSYETLRRWLREASPAFRAVQVTAEASVGTAGLIVVLPGGVRVEGLDLASLTELARRLA